MKHNSLFLCLVMLLPFVGAGQSISLLQSATPDLRCTGSVVSVSFTTSGTFAPGNITAEQEGRRGQFKVLKQ